MIHLYHTTEQLLRFKEDSKHVKIGDCVEGFGELWLCHKYDFSMMYFRCDLCDFHRCDIPCVAVTCSCLDRDDMEFVFFTNYK